MRRKYYKLRWLLTVIFTLTISGAFIFKNKRQIDDRNKNNIINKIVDISTEYYNMEERISTKKSEKLVTKSMSELGKMDEINKYILFLNSVSRSGSEILILLLQKLQGINSFKHVRLRDENERKLTKQQQENLIYEIYSVVQKEAVPLSFDRHVYFTNFSAFDKQYPTYINIIRDPVERIMSGVNLNKNKSESSKLWLECMDNNNKSKCNNYYKTGKPYDLTIPYFCGHEPRCMILNDDWALRTAKYNVEKYYTVVGVLEELNTTLEVLENRVPYFFKGAQNEYFKNVLDMYKHRRKVEIPKIIKDKFRKLLKKEYDFYEWIKGRLFQSLQQIYGDHDHQNH